MECTSEEGDFKTICYNFCLYTRIKANQLKFYYVLKNFLYDLRLIVYRMFIKEYIKRVKDRKKKG